MKSTHYYTREERQTMIITRFAILFEAHGQVWLTAGEIARGIGMSPSTHTKQLIAGLCFQGKLIWRDAERPGRGEVREYSLAPGTFQLPRRRAILVKTKGVVQGQLELGL